MRADIHDGREQTFPSKGRIQMRKTNNLQISQIQLAPHGRSIHMGQKRRLGRTGRCRFTTESDIHHDCASGRYDRSRAAVTIFAVEVRAMADHKFKIGQMVFFSSSFARVDAHRKTPYQITVRLPAAGSEFQYRIRSPGVNVIHSILCNLNSKF